MTGNYPSGADQGGDYLSYFFPGIMVMIVLFTAIFATISVIEDRQSGFLQGVLVSPGSRTAMVLGKVAGVTTLALVQAGLFLVIAPWAGYSFTTIDWPLLIFTVIATCVGFTSVGFTLAWILNSTMGYHGIMSVVLIPLWVVSGAMFPVDHGWLEWVGAINPLSYSVSASRAALQNGVDVGFHQSIELSCGVLLAFAVFATLMAARVCRKSSTKA